MAFIALLLLVSLVINLALFLVAFKLKSDKFTDITYSLTFIIIDVIILLKFDSIKAYQLIGFLMVLIWALRLGIYLLYRVIKNGRDKRFDDRRTNFIKFGTFWVGQALTVWILMLPLMYLVNKHPTYGPIEVAGSLIWLIGFLTEVVSDYQKNRFKSRPNNKHPWIDEGLWKYARHPNYFGEILVWCGIYIFAFSSLSTLERFVSLISPLWIYILLIYISGVPILEDKANEKWGKIEDYKKYKASTRLIVPLPKNNRLT